MFVFSFRFSGAELGMVDREIDKHVDLLPQVWTAGRSPVAGRKRRPGKVGLANGAGSRQSRTRKDQNQTRVYDQSRETGSSFEVSVFS